MARFWRMLRSCLACRTRKTVIVTVVIGLIFIIGNISFLHKFRRASSDHESVDIVWTREKDLASLDEQKLTENDSISHAMLREHDGKQEQIEHKEHWDAFNSFTYTRIPPKEKNIEQKVTEPPIVELSKHVLSDKQTSGQVKSVKKMAVLVIACNRVTVGRCLDRLFEFKPKDVDIPVIVSQDCGHEATASVIRSYGSRLKHIQQPDLGNVQGVPVNMMRFMGYYKISRHFKWALTQAFADPVIDSVIIVEDDLDIAPDFFDYFRGLRPLMDKDPSIFCVSAWNDNGREGFVDGIDLLYRSDFFPGLGWLITRKIWDELKGKWPLGFWDDWMRHPDQRKGRVCIRPEVSRTRTFGRVGVSGGQFFEQYLKYIKLNSEPYPFQDYDLSHLIKDQYDSTFLEEVQATPEYNFNDVLNKNVLNEPAVRITYTNNGEFEMLARRFGLMSDLKAGVPRTAYHGIVSFYRNRQRVYIAPKKFNGYHD